MRRTVAPIKIPNLRASISPQGPVCACAVSPAPYPKQHGRSVTRTSAVCKALSGAAIFARLPSLLWVEESLANPQVGRSNLDEFVGLEPGDPRSYHAFMRRHLFDHVNLAPRRIHLVNGAAPDLARECARYERAIARAGGIDLQILGLGLNGHIGFNEPARALVAATHRTRLRQATRRANAPLFGHRMRSVPTEALSMGMATILRAQRIVLLATGASKARCVERMTAGIVTPRVPASFLQLHRHAEVWLDGAAAGAIGGPKRATLRT